MQDRSGFPYIEAEFNRDGRLSPQEQEGAVLQGIREARLTDLLVISHGWNNDMADARQLYAAVLDRMRAVSPQAPLPTRRRLGALGVLWPSKKFTDRDLIPGGGAAGLGVAAGVGGANVSKTDLEREIDRLKEVAKPNAPDLDQAKALIDDLERDPAARKRFVELVRACLTPPSDADASGGAAYEVSGEGLGANSERIFADLRAPVFDFPPGRGRAGSGGAAGIGVLSPAGGAAGIGSLFASATAAAERLLNYATYYQMKERAGTVGRIGLADLLRAIHRDSAGAAIHLAGHSFGARVVSSAADACGAEVQPASLVLLQGAFSHNGFAPKFRDGGVEHVGFFRQVVESRKVAGPIVITHTANDKAVGLAYAIASRVARQAASNVGDREDLYGGIGRNGAVRTPEAEPQGSQLELLPPGGGGYNSRRASCST